MAFDFKLPDVGEGLHEGTLVEWLVAVGDTVTLDQPFCRVETDKAVVDLPAPKPALVVALHFAPGDVIEVGQVIATFDENASAAAGSAAASPSAAAAGTTAAGNATDAPPVAQALRAVERRAADGSRPVRPLATPHTRALARELGVDLATVVPTGRNGRVTDEDVEAAVAARRPHRAPTGAMETIERARPEPTQALPAVERSGGGTQLYPSGADVESLAGGRSVTQALPQASRGVVSPSTLAAQAAASAGNAGAASNTASYGNAPPSSAALVPRSAALAPAGGALDEPTERVALSHLRKVIADAMVLSKHTSAHVTHVDEADVTELRAMQRRARERVARSGELKLTLLPYFIKAVASTLRDHPLLNASYDADAREIVLKRYVHMGVAVDTNEGLIVPVLRHADRKDILGIARELDDLAARARQRRLTPAELRGGTFTVSSIGKLGGAFATPIIHQPELAIVGLHAIKQRPAVVDGAVVPREMMFVSCSYDHRIIDGMVAARFMADLIELLENPDMLMLRL